MELHDIKLFSKSIFNFEKKEKKEGYTTQKADATLTFPDGRSPVTKSKEVTKAVTELIGIDRNQFIQIVMIAQGEFQKLLNAKTDDRVEIFRNIFGWSATRSSALPKDIYDDLYELYILDKENLGVKDYFENVNPVAMQEMTATMLESARKGFWKANKEQLLNTASLNAQITENHGAPCTEFVCGNKFDLNRQLMFSLISNFQRFTCKGFTVFL